MKNFLAGRGGLHWVLSLVLLSGTTAWAHRVKTSDAKAEQAIVEDGGQLIADYGSYQLYEVDKVRPELLQKERVEVRDDFHEIQLNAGQIDTTAPEAKALRQARGAFAGKQLHLIQFAGPVQPAWHDALRKTGVRVVDYIPENTYLVYGNAQAIEKLQALGAVLKPIQWDGKYQDAYKIHPNARVQHADEFAIQLVDDPEANAATLAVIDGLKQAPIRRQYRILHYRNVQVRLRAEDVAAVAARPDVISIRLYVEPKKQDERQDQIIAGNLTGSSPTGPGYLDWLASVGFTQSQFTASGFVVDVSDSGIDTGTTSPGHFGLYTFGDTNNASRVVYNRLEGTANSGSTLQGCDGHGTLNTHVVAGFDDAPAGFPHTDSSGFHYGLGVCPFVRVGSSVVFDPVNFTGPNYANLASEAYADGARISNNSWGSNTHGGYDSDSQAYDALVRDAQPEGSLFPADGNQEMVFVFSDGDTGPFASSVSSPATAKNVIAVGGSENVLSMSIANGGNTADGSDGCDTPDSDANSANDIASFASRGPCADGRIKPDLVAPSSHITGGAPQTFPPPSPDGIGAALPCFLAINTASIGVCGLPGSGSFAASNFFPVGQQFFTVSSGTSHSAPAVAGACALVRQAFINQALTPPSPAMTKGYLMNSARYLTGSAANDNLWSNNQGMGELNLGLAFDGAPRILRDQLPVDKFTATGQTRSFAGTITDSGKPFRVTLAWTDSPGSTTGKALNNDLDLVVTVGGHTYKGNVFTKSNSVTGGSADHLNNVESVFLPAGTTGDFTITITAANINSDAVPGDADELDQDFALIAYNAVAIPAPNVTASSFALVSESCTPTNGAIDPGETVTVDFSLVNLGTADTSNLVVTLLATGGVSSPSGPQSYGVLPAGGAPGTQSFTFTAGGTCGGTLTNTFHLQDGANDLGSATFVLSLGELTSVLAEKFDSVVIPALPANWLTTATGAQSSWVTVTNSADSQPQSVFATDADGAGENDLYSPPITVNTSSARLSFRQRYKLESSSVTAGVAYDGGVLEIKIGTRAFTDIIKAGGTFANGGYGHTIASGFGNPLATRSCWSGDSPGFVTTIVNLPASVAGQTIQFRWRCASDDDTGAAGWFIDSVTVTDPHCCSGPDNHGDFTAVAGTYQGLILSNTPSSATSGMISLKVGKTGTFSAKFIFAGISYSLKGAFDNSGNVTILVPRTSGGALTVTLHLDVANVTDQITGTVSDASITSDVTANRGVFSTKTNPATQYQGTYTVLLPPNPIDAGPDVPQGYGYGSIKVDGSGKIKLTGQLGDGTKISQMSVLSKDGQWPVFIQPYSKSGVLAGWVTFTNIVGISDLNGPLTWQKPANPTAALYPNGFTTEVTLIGSAYTVPASGTPVLAVPNTACNLIATAGAGNLDTFLTNVVTLGTDNKITLCGTNVFGLKITATKGTFSGSFLNPATQKPANFAGGLFPKQNFAAGFFLDTDQTGLIILEPEP